MVCVKERRWEPAQLDQLITKMRDEWDVRARENARHYVITQKTDWTDDEFFASGKTTVADHILTDMTNICRGKDPKQMSVLEIGCGAGRVTKALADLFGTVYATPVQISFRRMRRQAC